MSIFKNFIVVIILVGVLTRIGNWFFCKHIYKKEVALYVSAISIGVFVCFLASFFLGFDIVISEYLIAFIVWFIFDLIKINNKEEKL